MPDTATGLTPYQADFLLDWLEADMDDAVTACETVDSASGKTIYDEAGSPDAQTFIDDLTSTLQELASSVDDEEGTAA